MRRAVLVLCYVLVAVNSASEYTDLEKAPNVDPAEYGTKAGKDIRAIARNYMHNLMKKQRFDDYIIGVKKLYEDNSDDMIAFGQEYSKTYTVHVAMVILGIVLFLMLLLGFFLTILTCCCACCCNTQKYSSSMAMWRMIWGGAVIFFLAVNIAGLAIAFVSGQQIMTLQEDTDSTIDKVAGDMVSYLKSVDNQLESLKSDQFDVFLGKIKPLINDTADKVVTEIKTTTTPDDFDDYITEIETALGSLDTNVNLAKKHLDKIDEELPGMIDKLNALDDTFTTCDDAITNCGTGCDSISNKDKLTNGIDVTQVEESKTTVDGLMDKVTSAENVGGLSLKKWQEFVTRKWTNLDKDIKEQIAPTDEEFQNTIGEAKDTFDKTLSDDVQQQLRNVETNITSQQDKIISELDATFQYLKDVALLKEPRSTDGVSTMFTNNETMVKYASFAVLVLTSVIVGFLLLTVILGLLAAILGCCKANDELLPTERETEPCRKVLCCTSICSIILCAFASLVAGLLLTLVMVDEGVCKANSDNKLISSIETLSGTFGSFDPSKQISDFLGQPLKLTDLWDGCNAGKTLGAVIDIDDKTEVAGFSISTITKQINEAIDGFDIATTIDDLNFNYVLVPDDLDRILGDAASEVTNFNINDIETKLAGDVEITKAEVSGMITDIQTAEDSTADQAKKDALKSCRTKLQTQLDDGQFEDPKPIIDSRDKIKNTLDEFESDGIKINIPDNAQDLTTNLKKVQDGLFGSTGNDGFVKKTLKTTTQASIDNVKNDVTDFADWLVEQFRTTILNCQPLTSTVQTLLNYTCDGLLIHITLLYSSLSLIGISLLFYMCSARALSRYFRNYDKLYPGDESLRGNGWGNNMMNNKVAPTDNYYSNTKL